jgi:hypothetical protein
MYQTEWSQLQFIPSPPPSYTPSQKQWMISLLIMKPSIAFGTVYPCQSRVVDRSATKITYRRTSVADPTTYSISETDSRHWTTQLGQRLIRGTGQHSSDRDWFAALDNTAQNLTSNWAKQVRAFGQQISETYAINWEHSSESGLALLKHSSEIDSALWNVALKMTQPSGTQLGIWLSLVEHCSESDSA